MTDRGCVFLEAWSAGFEPEPLQTLTEWADKHVMLSSKTSAQPGPYRSSRTPFAREIMDCLSPTSRVQVVVVMAGAQISKTTIGNNWIGYVIHRSPGPMLVVFPTVDIAKNESKQRIATMIADCEVLRSLVSNPRERDSGNTIMTKEFPGGILVMTGANSAAGLRRMPVRFLFLDEVDAYPGDVEGEGDPVDLAIRRTTTFSRKKILLTSTPTTKGLSRIEKAFKASDQRRYFVPCPHCRQMDWIRWENIQWEDDDPSSARLRCVACSRLIDERFKSEMLAGGEWRPTAEGPERVAGFHISGLYSPLGWKSWAECVADFLEAKHDTFKLKTWVNTVLGECWEERGDSVDAGQLCGRRETYAAEVPAGVGVLVASVDVQGDRLEVQVKGYGAGEESWLIAYHQILGDPINESVWFELDRFLQQTWTHETGQRLRIECTTIDSGGHHTEQVYRFCAARIGRRVFAVKGGSQRGRDFIGRPTKTSRYRIPLFVLCVDNAKERIHSRLRIQAPGPGYMHFPEGIDDEYFAQLTAEKAVTRYVKGKGAVREWVKLRERNEALDLEVYCMAALHISGASKSLPERVARFKQLSLQPVQEGAAAAEPATLSAPPAVPRPRRSNWANRWQGGF